MSSDKQINLMIVLVGVCSLLTIGATAILTMESPSEFAMIAVPPPFGDKERQHEMKLTDKQREGSLIPVEACRIVCCRCKKEIEIHPEYYFFQADQIELWLDDEQDYLHLVEDGLLCDKCFDLSPPVDITGGMDAVDYVRKIRRGEATE